MDFEKRIYTDPSQNFIERYPQTLDAVFQPKSIAVIGAKDTLGSVGRTIMLNLISGNFKGNIYPVNPKRDFVFEKKSYPTIKDIEEKIDLAIIVTPASTVPDIIEECVQAEVKAAIVISAGFKELGDKGLELEQEMLARAKKGNIRIIGPNCLGIMNPISGLNATFAKGMALPGNIAFISQSGAMCTAVLDWSLEERIGFSSFVSIGSMADVNWGDLINYLGGDPNTHSILIYMETIGDARSFLSAAREIALEKPIIVIKPGRSKEAALAAASHTGSLAGTDDVFEAAMERAGVLRVNTISELFHMASLLGRQPRPKGPKLAIITNAGGPSVLATDATVLGGAQVAHLSNESLDKLNTFLPPAWSHANPVDILGDANAETYAKTIDVIANDKENDGVLVILSPQDVTDPIKTAESLRSYARLKDKPLLASWMGGSFVRTGIQILNDAKIPTFEYPDDAASCFATMWKYAENLKSLYETPSIISVEKTTEKELSRSEKAKKIIDDVKKEGRVLLTEFESKKLLSLYHIPTVETKIASTVDEAVSCAKTMTYPVVLKLLSNTITHKSDVGGVKLNLQSEEDVKKAFHEIQTNIEKAYSKEDFQGVTVQPMVKLQGYELILGSSIDSLFGPILLFGAGGILVEVFKDSALALPPLNATLARKLMQKTKIYHALEGVRGRKPVDLKKLEEILVGFSLMIVENPWIKECDINPLLASDEAIIALDARVLLHDLDTKTFPKVAIRPYPSQYIVHKELKNNQPFTIRPIRPEDEPGLIAFHKELSENSIRQRFLEFVSLDARITHERLLRICFNDFDRDLAIVAELDGKDHLIMGVARLTRKEEGADLKLTISDPYHKLGIGTYLVEELISIAKKEKIKFITANILSENHGMIRICQKLGFQIKQDESGLFTEAVLQIK